MENDVRGRSRKYSKEAMAVALAGQPSWLECRLDMSTFGFDLWSGHI